MRKRLLAGLLVACMGLCYVVAACADGFENFLGGALEDIGAIVGGLTASSAGIPKEIHYGDFELFRQEIDAIERFFQEYADFIEAYDKNDVSMLVEYTAMLANYTEAMRVLDALDANQMTTEEMQYYNEMLIRISGHLISALDDL